MRRLNSPLSQFAYRIYSFIAPVIDPLVFLRGLTAYPRYFQDLSKYKQNSDRDIVLYPQLHDRTTENPFDAHYFYQQIWAFDKIKNNLPHDHVDIGSSYAFSGYISCLCPTTYIDIRPFKSKLPNHKVKKGSITKLPYTDHTLESVSCLHVIEHIGLGRYGDKLDPHGYQKAAIELTRKIKKGGRLLLSTPIGQKRTYFNAHHTFFPQEIVDLFPKFLLKSFSFVDDSGVYHEDFNLVNIDTNNLYYGCGFYEFIKK